MKSLSCQQRNYFIDRIKESINKEISALEQMHATNIQTVATKQYKAYMKETGLDKLYKKYTKLEKEWKDVQSEMGNVCEAIHESTEYPNKSNYFHRPYDGKDVETFLKKICNALARDGFIRSPKGRRLKELESKRRAAIDVVMGMTETEPTVNAINKILKGTNVPLLGGK